MSAIHHTMVNVNTVNYTDVNAFLFESETPFSADIRIVQLNQGVQSTIINWGDGTESAAYTGSNYHNFVSGGQFIVTLPNEVAKFDSLRFGKDRNLQMKRILNAYGLGNRAVFCGDQSDDSYNENSLIGNQIISSAEIGSWCIATFSLVSSIECYNFERFSGRNGDWIFPLMPNLESITFYGKTCAEMLSAYNFFCITNCMQKGSSNYKNTIIYCDDGYIQYDIDRYGREEPVLSHYKTVLY